MPGKCTTGNNYNKYCDKKKKVVQCFVGVKKGFDRILNKLGSCSLFAQLHKL